MLTHELDRGWKGVVIVEVEYLEHTDVTFATIMANDFCRSPPIVG